MLNMLLLMLYSKRASKRIAAILQYVVNSNITIDVIYALITYPFRWLPIEKNMKLHALDNQIVIGNCFSNDLQPLFIVNKQQ